MTPRRPLLIALFVVMLAVLVADVVAVATHKTKSTHAASPATTTTTVEPSTSTSETIPSAPPPTTPPSTAPATTAPATSKTTSVPTTLPRTPPTTAGSGTSGLTNTGAGQVAGSPPQVGVTGGPNLLGPGLILLALAAVARRIGRRRPALLAR